MEAIFLAKLIGLYFLISSLIVIVRRKSLMLAVKDLRDNPSMMVLFAFIELAAGLAIVVAYPTINTTVVGIISLVGYMLIVEGVIYMASPSKFMKRLLKRTNRPTWYIVGGIVGILLGAYLAGSGFGLL